MRLIEVYVTNITKGVEAVMKNVYEIGRRFCNSVKCNKECQDCDHGVLFKKEEKLPKQVEQALQEYKDLCLEGCLVISCQKCRHFRKLDSGMYTCKRERLAKFLVPYYRKEMDKIDEWVREQRRGVNA